jgi:hypothetical protein
MAKKFKDFVSHEKIAKGSSQGRRPNTSSMNKHKRRQTGVKIYKGQGR